ncbi:MAG: ABC transporter ATP-binding protein [Lachnospiraceae bacterium]|nr:ABC transporter ATP-binding protein [Lachnospiraceae bacterium]
MLTINKLNKSYGRFKALTDLDLHIERGDIFGFIGPNGAGKTTTMKIVCGLLSADSGEVYVDGIDALRENSKIKRKVGYVPDFFGVYDNLKVMEYMYFFASMYGYSQKDIKDTILGLLELVNLSDKQDSYVDGLSRGMKQRLCVARALIHDPDLLVLDEPASGLDPRARFEFKEILKNLGELDKTIIISSHILPELSEMCNTIGIMEKGHLIAAGNVEDIMRQSMGIAPLHIEVVKNEDVAVKVLKESPLVEKVSIRDNMIVTTFTGDDLEIANLVKRLTDLDVGICKIFREKGNLESVFLEITGNEGGAK